MRVKEGQLRNENMGWETFPPGGTAINLDSEHVLLIDQLVQRSGAQFTVMGNRYDLFYYNASSELLEYITPIYDTGTVTGASYAAGPDETTLTGSGTSWDTDPTDRNGKNNVVINDMIHIGDDDYHVQAGTWFRVKAVNSDTEIVVEGDATAGFPGTLDYTIRQRFSGDVFDLWRAEIFPAFDTGGGLEDRWYATNGIDNVVRWRGPTIDSGGATRVDLGFTCKYILRHKNLMLYANLVESGESKPQSIRTSDVGKPEDVTNGLASEFVPSDGVDPIMNMVPLSDLVAVYNERSVNLIQFVGDPFIFVARTAVPSIGLNASEAIVDFGDFHEFLSADAAYVFNGVGVEEFGSQVFREVLRTISPNRREKMLTHVDEENGEVHWIVPLTSDGTGSEGGPKNAYTEHYLETFQLGGTAGKPFTFRDLPATATGFFERATQLTWDEVLDQWINTNFQWDDRFFEAAFPFNLFGDENGYVFILGTTDSQHNGVSAVAIQSFARTPRRPLADGNRKGIVKRVEPYSRRRGGATGYTLGIELYVTDRPHGDVTLAATGTHDLTHAGSRFTPFRNAGRYAELRFVTNGLQQPWELDGWSVNVLAAGER